MSEKNQYPLENNFLYSFLNPESVTVFGANNEYIGTMGAMQLRNVIFGGFPKDKIFPIHPNLKEVQGLKSYQSVLDLPEIPDLAFIILRPNIVPQVLEECGQKGIKRAIITSGGFREIGNENLYKELIKIADKYNIRFIGPNCLGVYNAWYRYPEFPDTTFNTMWIYETPQRGNISIIAHSGTIASHIFWGCREIGVKISKSFSIGNEDDIDIVDCLDYLKDDTETNVIGLYIEEIKRGKEFIELVREITPKKPIVAIYAGGTNAASRGIMGHTGAIAGDDNIFESVFKETGIISTISIKDFMYYLRTFSSGIFPKGNRLGILTDSGGCGAMMAKAAEKYGLAVPEFSEELKSKLEEHVVDIANIDNPLDLTFSFGVHNKYIKIPKLMINSGEIDGIIIYAAWAVDEVLEVVKKSGGEIPEVFAQMTNEMMSKAYLEPIQKFARKKSAPILYICPQGYSNAWVKEFIRLNIPIFDLWDMPVKSFSALVQYSEYRKKFSQQL
ncbi:MAG: CoA-binding protein [Promethearchaeota archaeon]